jgi:hypothetical protein
LTPSGYTCIFNMLTLISRVKRNLFPSNDKEIPNVRL